MIMRRLFGGLMAAVLFVSAAVPVAAGETTDYTAVAAQSNRERYRGAELTAEEQRIYTDLTEAFTLSESETAQLNTLTATVVAGKEDEYARLCAIHDWVTDVMAYDEDQSNGMQGAPGGLTEILSQNRGVCVDFSTLTMALCRTAGIPCRRVDGYVLKTGETWNANNTDAETVLKNHEWNEAYAGGRWVILDTTWDCGNVIQNGERIKRPASRANFDITPEKLAEARLSAMPISDGWFEFTDKEDGSLTLRNPLDRQIATATVPSRVGTRAVTAIASRAFEKCTALTVFSIPDSVIELGDGVFSGCTALRRAEIPAHITTFGGGLFQNCTALSEVAFPANWTVLPKGICTGCSALKTVTLPAGLEVISRDAFSGCAVLSGIAIPESVKTVGENAFSGCASFTSVTLPEAVHTLSAGLFSDCSALQTVSFSDAVDAIPAGAFSGCTSLTTIRLSENVKKIGANAFMGCTSLSAITLPRDLSQIGANAFERCTALQELAIPSQVSVLADNTFSGCEALRRVTMPDTMTQIGKMAFSQCKALTTLRLPADLKKIGADAFSRCDQLDGLVLPEHLTEIEAGAFLACQSLSAIRIPAGVKAIHDQTFKNCASLAAIEVDEKNPTLLDRDGVLFTRDTGEAPSTHDKVVLVCYPAGRTAKAYTVTSDVVGLYGSAFMQNTYLETVNIEATIPSIDDFCFYGCSALREVTIGEGVSGLGRSVFRNCKAIETVKLSKSLQRLDLQAFQDCAALRELTIPAGVTMLQSTYPIEGLEAFHVEQGNKNYYDLDGVLFNRRTNSLIGYPMQRAAVSYTIPEGTTFIGNRAFYGQAFLKSVQFPTKGLTGIGESAFSESALAGKLTLPEGVTNIGRECFTNTQITGLSLPQSLVEIGGNPFQKTPWWNNLPNGPVYCDNVLLGVKKAEEEDDPQELIVAEGTRMIGIAAGGLYDSITIPASVTVIQLSKQLGMTVYGYGGTAAQTYAEENGMRFVQIGKEHSGNVDGDDKVTTTDARLVLQFTADKIGVDRLDTGAADVDRNGTVTTTDARMILQFAADKIHSFI